MPFPVFRFASTVTGAALLAAALGLTACASKNPLMEEPTAAAPAHPATAPAAAGNARVAQAPGKSEPGVQTSKERRLFGIFSPYRPDVQQGNFVSREMVAQLKPGMTPDQVRFVLGTPLLTDVFHANRWDYVFRLEKGNGNIIASRITVHFQDNRLARVDNGELPTEKDYLSLIAGGAKPAAAKRD